MIHIRTISFIGSGNVATHLALALKSAGFKIKEVYSLDFQNALKLAKKLDCGAINSVSEMDSSADLYLISIPDGAIKEVTEDIPRVHGIVAHTSGITPMNVLDKIKRFGVFYPLQTFSKQRDVKLSNVPICIEASSGNVMIQLKETARKLSNSVYEIDTEQRKYLHLTAVMVNNYTNYLYRIAFDILKTQSIDHQLLMPLIEETVSKILTLHPKDAQTGPARRNDVETIDKHVQLLNEQPQYKELYTIFAEQLIKKYNE